jgi:hypothetical protein
MRQKTKPGKAGLRLWSDVRGVAALEFAFVVPFFGAIFFIQNNMATAAREVSRSLSVGTIETAAEAESLANDRLVNWGISFNVNTTIPDPDDPNDTDYTVVITAPLSDAAIFDILGVFQSGSLRAQASMREEG